MIGCSSGNAFEDLSGQFWSTILRCGTRLQIHTLNYWIVKSVVLFLTGGVFEYDIAHCRSAAELCMLYPLYGAIPGSYMPGSVTCGALVTHRYTFALPHCRTSVERPC